MLAAKQYNQPDLVQKILGPTLNPAQIQPGTNVRAGLENGTFDVTRSYKVATRLIEIPFLSLPPDVNLSDLPVREHHPEISLSLNEKTFHPEPLVFYVAHLNLPLTCVARRGS